MATTRGRGAEVGRRREAILRPLLLCLLLLPPSALCPPSFGAPVPFAKPAAVPDVTPGRYELSVGGTGYTVELLPGGGLRYLGGAACWAGVWSYDRAARTLEVRDWLADGGGHALAPDEVTLAVLGGRGGGSVSVLRLPRDGRTPYHTREPGTPFTIRRLP